MTTQIVLLGRWKDRLEWVRQEIVSGICNNDELRYLEKEEESLEQQIDELEQELGHVHE